jgi:hypothetical protein
MTNGNARLARTFAVTALLAGVAAAWLVSDYTGSVERRGGRPTEVLVAKQAIARGKTMSAQMFGSVIGRRAVPRTFVPADAATLDSLDGARAAADIATGAYLTQPLFVTGRAAGGGYKLRRTERALTVDAKVSPDGATVEGGAIVDVFASGLAGGSESSLLLSGAEVLAADGETAGRAQQRLTLRVLTAQAPALIRGDVFARELRAVVRP